jgi:hypothetical protein
MRVYGALLLLAALLGGCAGNVAPPQALLTAGSGQAASPAIAVEANGTKHVVWSECTSTGATTRCKLVYWRTRIGPATLQIDMVPPGSDERYDLPNIAVSADGQAYVIWRFHIGDSGPYRYYYSMIRPDGSYDSPIPLELAAGAERPLIAARGNVVYTVYHSIPDSMPASDDVWLSYQRLSPLGPATYLSDNFNSRVGAASMAIDSSYNLHVVWAYAGPAGYQALFYGKLGMIRLLVDDTASSPLYSAPAIAIDADDTAQVVFATYGGASDTLTRWTRDSSGTETPFVVPLGSAHNPWRIHGSPQIATVHTTPIVVFSAKNGATANDEIWSYSPPASGVDSGPERVTTNTWEDDEPQVLQLDDMNPLATMIAWRKYEVTSLASPALVERSCQSDAYEYDQLGLRQVFRSPGNICASGVMLAGNGDWVGGVWIDSLHAGSTRAVPWLSFNSYGAFLPLLQH